MWSLAGMTRPTLQPSACLQNDSLSTITAMQPVALMHVNYLDLSAAPGYHENCAIVLNVFSRSSVANTHVILCGGYKLVMSFWKGVPTPRFVTKYGGREQFYPKIACYHLWMSRKMYFTSIR